MANIIKNYRYYVLTDLGLVAIVGIFSLPTDDCQNWFVVFIISKLIGIAATFAAIFLTDRWLRTNKFPELNKYLED